jgi:peptidase E
MAVYALIGGKSNLEVKVNKIEQHILSLTNKEKPKLLYCPYASNDYEKSNRKFKELINNLNCELYLLTSDDYNRFDELLNWCDCLYVGGGSSDDLVELFKTKGFDKLLVKYQNTNKIYAGISAGAMLYTKAAMGDKYAFYDNFVISNYKMVDCLGLIEYTICPHYQSEGLTIYNCELKNYPYPGFGIEDDTCVIIQNDKISIIKENNTHSVYYFDKNDNYKMIPLYEGKCYE